MPAGIHQQKRFPCCRIFRLLPRHDRRWRRLSRQRSADSLEHAKFLAVEPLWRRRKKFKRKIKNSSMLGSEVSAKKLCKKISIPAVSFQIICTRAFIIFFRFDHRKYKGILFPKKLFFFVRFQLWRRRRGERKWQKKLNRRETFEIVELACWGFISYFHFPLSQKMRTQFVLQNWRDKMSESHKRKRGREWIGCPWHLCVFAFFSICSPVLVNFRNMHVKKIN